jgi:hypothetical protein
MSVTGGIHTRSLFPLSFLFCYHLPLPPIFISCPSNPLFFSPLASLVDYLNSPAQRSRPCAEPPAQTHRFQSHETCSAWSCRADIYLLLTAHWGYCLEASATHARTLAQPAEHDISAVVDLLLSSLIWKSGHTWPLSLAHSHRVRVAGLGREQPQGKRV